MVSDIRGTTHYREAEELFKAIRQPGTGKISDAAEMQASPDGTHAVFTGTLVEELEGSPATRICLTELATADTRVLTVGPNTDRLPKYSPDGKIIAFLSDRHKAGDFQLYLLDPSSGATQTTSPVEGWVEYLHWSPNGERILLGVAGHGADVSGGQGAVTSKRFDRATSSWMPALETGDESYLWRRAWVYELATGRVHQVSQSNLNIWESVWCGNHALAAVVSLGPTEGLWYSSRLRILNVGTGESREVYVPQDQLGWLAASPSGAYLAIVESICSDRGIVAGDSRLIDTASGNSYRVDTQGMDITHTEWRSEQVLLFAGVRGFETAVAIYDVPSARFTEVWQSSKLSTGGYAVTISGLNEAGDCLLVGEGFLRAPEIASIRQGQYRSVKSFDLQLTSETEAVGDIAQVSWEAPDGLRIQGWLLRPVRSAPHSLVMNIHGGPVMHWRPTWLGRRALSVLMLLKRGYAIFLPNPRGSSGRGQDFARRVLGDMGGADTYDYLSGLDHLVEQQMVDPKRLGVTGVSYGGFMTYWLVTQDPRFAAAVAIAPMSNFVTQDLLSNIPHFTPLFLADRYNNPCGKYFQRSPVMHAHRAKTPTLSVCGALDRCTPPQEAMQFHKAMLENGGESTLLIYPEEGHGVRNLPAAIDYAARVVAWFTQHMPASTEAST